MEFENEIIKKKAVLVVCVIDDYTDKMIYGSNIQVFTGSFKSYRREDGYYVFINLPSGIHKISIESDFYYHEEMVIDTGDINSLNPVVFFRVKPNTIYPIPSRATCIRGEAVIGSVIAGNTRIEIENLSEQQSIKIAEDGVKAGKKALKLYKVGDMRLEGKEFTLNDSEEEKRERIKILNSENEVFALEKPLKYSHRRGVTLIPIEMSYTDKKGNFMILPKQVGAEKINLRLLMEYNGVQTVKEVSIESGENLNVGKINLKE